MKPGLRAFLLVSVAICLSIGMAIIYFFNQPVIKDPNGYRLLVKTGATPSSIGQALYTNHLIPSPLLFKLTLRVIHPSGKLKAGEYFFKTNTTFFQLVNQLATGQGMIYHSFMIVSGWTFKQVREALLKEPDLKRMITQLSDEEVMKALGAGESLQAEGQFYPETYFFIAGDTDVSLLKRAYQLMQKKLFIAWQGRAPGLPFQNSYEALIAASLVEKEAYLNEEKPLIAGVLINRLKKDMRLQFDPTVIYGLGEKYDGKIHKTDLTLKNSYNTYMNKGLPPTPIAMPSLLSIMAVLHPMNHHYLYFVARGDGGHQFSETLIEHHEAVKEAKVMKWRSPPFFNVTLMERKLIHVLSL